MTSFTGHALASKVTKFMSDKFTVLVNSLEQDLIQVYNSNDPNSKFPDIPLFFIYQEISYQK